MMKINGFPVIATFNFPKAPLTRAWRVIIVDRGAYYVGNRFVAATQYGTNEQENGIVYDAEWSQGYYVDTLFEAYMKFRELVERSAFYARRDPETAWMRA